MVRSWLLSKDMIWGKPFCFVHPKFSLLCMSIMTLEQILIWVLVLVLVLDMKVLDVLKYFKKMSTACMTMYLYLVYIWSTWFTWVLGQLYLTPTLVPNGSTGKVATWGVLIYSWNMTLSDKMQNFFKELSWSALKDKS